MFAVFMTVAPDGLSELRGIEVKIDSKTEVVAQPTRQRLYQKIELSSNLFITELDSIKKTDIENKFRDDH